MVEIGQGLSIVVGLPTIASWRTADRPKKAKLGTFGLNLQTNNLEYWDGSNWLSAEMS